MIRPLSLLLLAFLPSTAPLRAELHLHEGWRLCACKARLLASAASDPEGSREGKVRRYARDREIDLKHLRLDLNPDFEERAISGEATYTFAPIAKPLARLRLDAVDLDLVEVKSPVAIQDRDVGKTAITLTFAEPIPPGAETTISLVFRAHPQDGWFFRTAAMGYPDGDDHFWTQGQPERHRHWFPCYDYPNERFTSEVICRVPAGMTVVSNGRLVEQGPAGDLTLFHWRQEQEHVNYLISVVGGYFKRLESAHGKLPLAFLAPPSEFAVAENSFRDTAAILAFFEEEIDVKYPWEKYYSVCVADFIAGGMENTSVTTLTTETLFSADSENLRTSHRLDAHEIAHQWFGNLVTCKDWSHLWLNEGFATYYTHLYDGRKSGPDEMRYRLLLDARSILANPDEKPVVWRGYGAPMEQFDYRAYPKGAWTLHMLRSQLGPELFREAIRTYLDRHRNGNVVTQDLLAAVEEVSGRSFDRFFDQWLLHGGEPVLKIDYAWDESLGQAKLTVRQTQATGDKLLLFDFPLPVRFVDAEGTRHDRLVEVTKSVEDFHFSLPGKPAIVRLDPEVTLLAKIDFDPPKAMLEAQLADEGDAIGRLLAVAALGGRKDAASLSLLGKHLRDDAFYGVRVEAAKALAKTGGPEALELLRGSRDQADARVRREVVSAIGTFYDDFALAALAEHAGSEKNPDILAELLPGLGKYPGDEVRELLLASLERPSYRHRIASAAIRGLGRTQDPALAGPVLAHLAAEEARFPGHDFSRALETLAELSKEANDGPREEVRRFLLERLDHPKEVARRSAISALGTLGDPRSLAALEPISQSRDPDHPETKAAAEAVRKLRGEKAPSTELGALRREMLDGQREMRTLREELETLRKRVEAAK